MGDKLKEKTIGALKWTTIDKIGQQIMQFVIGVILARLLTPEEFGLIGVLLIFNALSTVLIDGGFGQALVRKQNATIADFSTIFYFNLFISLLLYCVLYMLSPYISAFFSQDELTKIGRVYFLSIIFYALYFIQYVIVIKEMQYKKMAVVNIVSVLISGIISIILAYNDWGVWTLVIQQLIFHFLRAVLFFYFVNWKPKLMFRFQTIRDFWKLSINLLGVISLNVIFNHIYTIIIGRFFPVKQVGYYNQANKLSETVNSGVLQILQNTIFPVFVQLQDQRERFVRIFRKMTSTISFLYFPLIVVLILVSEPLILILLSEKWSHSIGLFQLLLLSIFFSPLYSININSLNANGDSNLTFKLEIVKKILISLSIVGLFSFGIEIMLVGLIASNMISYFYSMAYIKKVFMHYFKQQFTDISQGFLISLVIGVIVFSLNYFVASLYLRFILQLISAALLFVVFFRHLQGEMYGRLKLFLLQKIIR